MALTPFAKKLRELRQKRGMTQKDMAKALGVSAAYLSALENGKRGVPRWIFVQEIIRVLNVIWDDADELQELAFLSNPRVTIDTSDLSVKATELANVLNETIGSLPDEKMEDLISQLEAGAGKPQEKLQK